MDITISKQDFSGFSFAEAFSAARAELGNRGIFFFNGKPFNTLTSEEQRLMPPEEWQEFSTSVQGALRDAGIGLPIEYGSDYTEVSTETADVYAPENLADGLQPDPGTELIGAFSTSEAPSKSLLSEIPSDNGGGFWDFLNEFFED